jgi:hypothetical protein
VDKVEKDVALIPFTTGLLENMFGAQAEHPRIFAEC